MRRAPDISLRVSRVYAQAIVTAPRAACALLLVACETGYWAEPQVLAFSDGSIGVVANRAYSGDGGGGPGDESRCVRSFSGTWECTRIELSHRIVLNGRTQHWLRTRAGREYFIFEGIVGPLVWTSVDGAAWSEVTLPLGPDALPLGSAWVTSDDALHVVVGTEEWVVRDAVVERMLPWPVSCTDHGEATCFYDPLDDVEGHFVRYFIDGSNQPALELSSRRCAGTSCDVTSLGLIGETDHDDGRLVHRLDGTPTFVHRGRGSGYDSPVQVSTRDASFTLRPADVFFFDAVALSDGRIAVALVTSSNALWLVLVGADGETSSATLGTGDFRDVSVALFPQPGGSEHVLVVSVDRDRGHLFEVTTNLELVLRDEVPLTP